MLENKYKPHIVKMVTEQVINMWNNNVLNEYGAEGFVGWVADGEVFDTDNEEDLLSAMEMVQDIAPMVDELTFNYLNVGY